MAISSHDARLHGRATPASVGLEYADVSLRTTGNDALIRAVAAGASGRVQVWTVPDAGHTDGLATEPDEWADRVAGFLSETLVSSSRKATR